MSVGSEILLDELRLVDLVNDLVAAYSSFVVNSPIFARVITFATNCPHHTIRRVMDFAEAGMKSVKNILRKSFSSGANAYFMFMLYEWRNVPCSDGYAQKMFGRAQRTSLPSLPSQNMPINFNLAASSTDAAHARAKPDHDRSKLSSTSSSPGQEVYLQDSKSCSDLTVF